MFRTNIKEYYIIFFNGKYIRRSNVMKLYKFLKFNAIKKDNNNEDNIVNDEN